MTNDEQKEAMKPYTFVALLAMLGTAPSALSSQCAAVSGERRVALLELYTSEGCDSCPPTDRWVSALPTRGFGLERLVVLGFHVDYWNHLGWPDPYAQKKFTDRQQAASTRNRARFVYTPQLLLDGRDFRRGLVRDESGERIAALNQRPPGASLRLALNPDPAGALSVTGTATLDGRSAHDAVQTYVALYENNLANRITRGENRGKHLRHDFVVRELAGPFRAWQGKSTEFSHTFQFGADWKTKDLHVSAFVQDGVSGEILQALALRTCG
jgi:hypothetical protein